MTINYLIGIYYKKNYKLLAPACLRKITLEAFLRTKMSLGKGLTLLVATTAFMAGMAGCTAYFFPNKPVP